MDVWDTIKACVRNWFVFVPVLLLGLAATQVFTASIAPTYSANASLIFLERNTTPPGESAVNPYSRLGPDTFTHSVGLYMRSSDGRAEIAAQSPRGEVGNVVITVQPRSEVMEIAVTSNRADVAIDTLRATVNAVTVYSRAHQDSVSASPTLRFEPQVVSEDTNARASQSDRKRAFVVLAGLSGAIAIVSAVLYEYLVRGRERVRTDRTVVHRQPFGRSSDTEDPPAVTGLG